MMFEPIKCMETAFSKNFEIVYAIFAKKVQNIHDNICDTSMYSFVSILPSSNTWAIFSKVFWPSFLLGTYLNFLKNSIWFGIVCRSSRIDMMVRIVSSSRTPFASSFVIAAEKHAKWHLINASSILMFDSWISSSAFEIHVVSSGSLAFKNSKILSKFDAKYNIKPCKICALKMK